jgi:hypothetical protein
MVIVCYFYQSECNPLIHEERRPKAQAGACLAGRSFGQALA